ncbi:type II secretion system minor pseudopilin GspK [Sphingomonas aracearum]|uniref:Type II secretion system protein K n=1 Tax=Sphingomonas aracearum TaxID=2283317 RepID=A0A369VVE5_9SPHN|nr:type II secretion system minor pseudopilin GspK [Sphingomonas aracearum]RDE05150.1 general secretion pathway protein GspK [Sphingomonas aracearum]
MPVPDRERGAALLTVLLLVAIISVMAGTALEKMRLSTRLASNAVAGSQARAWAQAAETMALLKVTDVLGRDASRVTLAGNWSNTPVPLPIPEGTAVARVRDGGNCFNLNGLVTETTPGVYAAYAPAMVQFTNLMRLVGVTGQNPEAITAATTDWIDSGNDPLPNGAEDSSYKGYRTANTLMADVSELRAVSGMTAETYARLRPWLCTLPKAEPSKVNVNTLLPEQAPLLAMLLPQSVAPQTISGLLLRRPPQGYESVTAFWQGLALGGQAAGPEAERQTAITTQWFALDIQVVLNDAELEQHGLIDATRLPARIVSRAWGERS